MLNKIILAFFLSAILIQASDLGTRKSEELRAKVLGHPGIPTLSAAEYKYFLEETPRPYDVVVFFTAPKCKMCDEVEAELTQVANLYKNNGAVYPINEENGKQRAVYFVKVSYETATKEIFVGLHLKTVPNILVSTPKILRLRENEKVEHYRNFLWEISTKDKLTSKKLLNYVNEKTGRNVEYKESILNLFLVMIVLCAFLAAGVFAFLKFRPFFLSPKLWMVGSMLVYFICMSGFVYNMIQDRPLPLVNIGRNGNLEWIIQEGRSQYRLEGYIVSGTISFVGILFIILLKIPKLTESKNGWIAYLGLFLLIIWLIKWVESIYKWKSGFPSPSFYPPDHYIRGPLGNDQGRTV